MDAMLQGSRFAIASGSFTIGTSGISFAHLFEKCRDAWLSEIRGKLRTKWGQYFSEILFKNANTLAVASSTFAVASIMAGSFAIARIIAIPAMVCTIGYSVAVMTAAIAVFEQFSIAISEKGFSLEFNPDFWKSVSRVSTIASIGYFALHPHWQAEDRAKAGTERYYSTQREFTNPIQQKTPDYMGYGIAIAITAILVFLLKRRK